MIQEKTSEHENELKSGIADHKSETGKNETGTFDASFWNEAAPQATRYAMSIVRCWSDAEEVVQEAFCRMIESGTLDANQPDPTHTQQPLSGIRAILFATVRNLSIDRLRKLGRRKFENFDSHEIAANASNTYPAQLERLENGVLEGLKNMPGEWADALQLKINGDLSYQEISNVLGVTHGQVRTWIFRARKQLAKDLKQKGLLDDGNEE